MPDITLEIVESTPVALDITSGTNADLSISSGTAVLLETTATNVDLSITNATPINIEFSGGQNGADGQGVPVGGSTNQLLVKISGADFDTGWVSFSVLFYALTAALPTADSDASSGVGAGEAYITSSDHVQCPGGLIKII